MSTIVTRAGKGVPLTATDHDNNVNNLNTDKVENLSDLSITATSTELNYVDGVTSAIQTQLNAALPKAGGAMTGAITTNSTFDGVDIATRDGVLTTTTTTANAALPKAGGTMTGELDANAGITTSTPAFKLTSEPFVSITSLPSPASFT